MREQQKVRKLSEILSQHRSTSKGSELTDLTQMLVRSDKC